MGTSVEMIDRTYGHLAADAEEYERPLLDAYDAKSEFTTVRVPLSERLGRTPTRRAP